MADVSEILSRIERGDQKSAEQLLPIVYEELRKLAAARLSKERPGQTLQATALVHEAYLRLVDAESSTWNSRAHFFGSAAEAMRRILVERARRKQSLRGGGGRRRLELENVDPVALGQNQELDILALDEALTLLAAEDSRAAKVVSLRFFAGLTVPEVAEALGVSVTTAENDWSYAKSWLKLQLRDPPNPPDSRKSD